MPTRREPPRGPGRARRVLTAAGVAASVLLNVWAVSASGDRGSSSNDQARGPSVSAPSGTSSPTPASTAQPSGTAAPTITDVGDGRFTVVALPAPSRTGSPATKGTASPTPTAGRTVRYTVETEGKLGADTAELAAMVATVLADPRGWQTKDAVHFVNVTPADAAQGAAIDVRITLASPDTTDRLCAPLDTGGEVSCHNQGRVVLNLRRWLLGAEAYGTDLAAYRTYLVNHEVGHALGHGHVGCPGKGKDAPVMMQQTYGLDGCAAWPWPTARPT